LLFVVSNRRFNGWKMPQALTLKMSLVASLVGQELCRLMIEVLSFLYYRILFEWLIDRWRQRFARPILTELFISGKLVPGAPTVRRWVRMPIVYHDSHFLIVNKPYDVNIDRRTTTRPTVESMLLDRFPHYKLRNLHQLDFASKHIYI
jgi:23S rRNA-/tRNA-specific pseudouridylate synthase